MSAIGAGLPPHLRHLSKRVRSEEQDSEDENTPSLPPNTVASTSNSKPASRPTQLPSGTSYTNTYTYNSDDDDDIGPKPLPANAARATADPVGVYRKGRTADLEPGSSGFL
ncbi:hypothetical protein BDP27DRAFT_1370479 [Rhodocollybia butyracea]|uniref:Uncharacterized protein n=1 Tax=Rhodocollybia butyracea TaxID=206335 RepID=A0A9P5TYN7_9AGAR|nr:hypothetical protein BDP27DRAFT_1370916 [Rhodocollybia butyracea]KAF9060525.1 hypothetical protein BDP27DRAFT_1370479 [Rhodocollybia butyracea]